MTAERFGGVWSPATPDRLLDGAPAFQAVGDVVSAGLPAERRGGFACASIRDGALHLARDGVGHRSLYWSQRPDGALVFGSTLHEVLARDPRRALDPHALALYLSCAYVPGERTLLAHIRALPPGVELVATSDGVTLRPFWDLPPEPAFPEDEGPLRDRLRHELELAVQRALPDGPVTCFLSGGIDSSLVTALAARHRPLRALSVAFGPEHRNELPWSQAVARHVGAPHEVVEVLPRDVTGRLDEAMAALSEPNGDPLTVPNLLMFAAASGEVVLNGEGGDPCFGGPKNAPMLLAQLYDGDPPAEAWLHAHQRCYEDLRAMLRQPPPSLLPELQPWFTDRRWPSFLNRLMAINVALKGPYHILPKVEHLAARYGAQVRSPLFDRDVVELAFAIPPNLKRKGPIEKHLLKEAVRDLLPDAVVDRPKSGMMVPVEGWFSGELLGFARERLLDGLAAWDLLDRVWLERLVDRRLSGVRPRQGVKVWMLVALEAWLRQVVGRP